MGRRGGCRRGRTATVGGHDTSATAQGRGISTISKGEHGCSITSRGRDATAPQGRRGGHSLSRPVESSSRSTTQRETNDPTSLQAPSSSTARIIL